MRVGGQWVGLGLGDSSLEVQKIKAFMRRRFASYCGALDDTPLYDDAMVAAVTEMQRRYQAAGKLTAFLPGVVNPETKYVMGYLPRPPAEDRRPVLLTVCGTGVPWWIGPDADLARAVEDRYRWQPIGYPAAPFPMGPSIAAGKAELANQLELHRTQIERHGCALAGYSQGAIVVSEVWEESIRTTGGALWWVREHLTKAVTWGNPNRERGQAWPDPGAPMAALGTQGVTGTLMTDTPSWWRNYAHAGDLYTASTADEVGEDKTAAWQIIRGTRVFDGPDSLLAQFLEIAQQPVPGAIAAFRAILDAGLFFARRTGPHVNYDVRPAIDYLRAP